MSKSIIYKYWFLNIAYDDVHLHIYFFPINFNALFVWNLKENKVTYLGKLENNIVKNELYTKGIVFKDKVYFPPRMSNQMAIYDINEHKLSTKELYPSNPFCGIRFCGSYHGYIISPKDDRYLYFIYRDSPLCVKWDCVNECTSYITCHETGIEVILSTEYVLDKNKCYVPAIDKNILIELDMNDDSMYVYHIGDNSCGYQTITKYDNALMLLSTKEKEIMEWYPETKSYRLYKIEANVSYGGYDKFFQLVYRNKKLMLIPGLTFCERKNDILQLNLKKNTIKYYNLFAKYEGLIKWPIFRIGSKQGYAMFERNQNKYMLTRIIFVVLDLDTLELQEFKLPLPDGWNEKGMSDCIEEYQRLVNIDLMIQMGDELIEKGCNDLKYYLDYVKKFKNTKEVLNVITNYGKLIHEEMLK